MPDTPLSAMPKDRPDQQPTARDPAQPKRTPGTDMQAEDAGTPESGQPESRGTPAAPATKETGKSGQEPGRRG